MAEKTGRGCSVSGPGEGKGGSLLALAEQAEQNLNAAAGGGSLPGLSPAGPEAVPEIDQQAVALGEAETVVEMAAGAVKALYPVLNYTPEVKGEAAQKLAPLLQKYGGNVGWLSRWKEEIDAGMFFAGLVYGSWRVVQEAKAKEAEQEAAGGAGGD